MAVHLNARLKTRFIPFFLFTAAALVSVLALLAHASPEGLPVSREEIQMVMSEGVDPGRLDRRPGFSPIVVAPRPGEHPSTGASGARKEEEPLPEGSSSSISDELPAQPGPATSDQR